MSVHDIGGSLPHEKRAMALEDARAEPPRGAGHTRTGIWQPGDDAFGPRHTVFCHWTYFALRLPRSANCCAQFHQRLVEGRAGACERSRTENFEVRVCGRLHQRFSQTPQTPVRILRAYVSTNAKHAGQNANHVAIKNGHRLVESDAADGARGGAAED